MQKGQVIFIHGGDTHNSNEDFYAALKQQSYEPHAPERKRWRDDVAAKLEAAGYEWLFLAMPNKQNADYEAWKIWFEKVVPFIEAENSTQIVAYSLGACFMLKYLAENQAPFTIDDLHLVAPSLDDGELGSFIMDETQLGKVGAEASRVAVYHSTDDHVCRFSDSERIVSEIPNATLHTFSNRNHFLQPEFPELLAQIQKR